MKNTWKKVSDTNVLMVWKCTSDDCALKGVPPTFYEEAGTPVCEECGGDMSYSHTLVNTLEK